MRSADFVPLPVHGERRLARLHDAIHPDVANPALRITRDHHRERDVCATVLRPTLHERKSTDVDIRIAPDNLLTWWRARALSRRKSADLEQLRQER